MKLLTLPTGFTSWAAVWNDLEKQSLTNERKIKFHWKHGKSYSYFEYKIADIEQMVAREKLKRLGIHC